MKIIFLGSAQFAVPALQALHKAGHIISCVVTQPDKHKGRGLPLASTAVKEAALAVGMRIYQPADINTTESVELLTSLKPDILIVVAYGQILSSKVLAIPQILPLNLHASLLPYYRGAAPVNWAIIRGEKTTGVTIMKVIKEMDAGPIITQKTIAIRDDETAEALASRLSVMGAEVLLTSLAAIAENKYSLASQEGRDASYAPKLKKAHGLINWNDPMVKICNLVRGLSPWPSAFTHYKGKLLKITIARPYTESRVDSFPPGTILCIHKEGIEVKAGDGSLLIEELQIEGKKKMPVSEFIQGHKIKVAEKLGE